MPLKEEALHEPVLIHRPPQPVLTPSTLIQVSLMMAQLPENRKLKAVFDDLFRTEGSKIYLKSASDYVVLSQPLNFHTVLGAARRRGEITIVYRLKSEWHDSKLAYGVHLNPRKPDTFTLSDHERVIVLAES